MIPVVKYEEVVKFYTDLKTKVSEIKDPNERHSAVMHGLSKYTISQWCDVGNILKSANLI